ncbi:MAG: phenylacetate--CoA ligase family protein [Paracoccaceae bacterium]
MVKLKLAAKYFDELEIRSDEQREENLSKLLPEHLKYVRDHCAGMKESLSDLDLDTFYSINSLQKLPVLRKNDLANAQKENPPLGGYNAIPITEFDHLFQSPGPIFEPGKMSNNWWRGARGLYASGFRDNDIIQNCFSYHLTPAGMMYENAGRAIGATVLPAGTGQTDMQVASCSHFGVSAYVGTPDYLKVILDKAEELGFNLSKINKAHVGGGALFPSLRQEYKDRGINCLQSYGTADLGLIAYETESLEGMIVDEGVLVEIVTPGTGNPVDEGEVGEVLVTNLNRDYPLIRFATGDLSAFLPGTSACGRTNVRIKGWMGRADQTTKIKGMFVRPEQVAEFVRRNKGIIKARIVAKRRNEMDQITIQVEVNSEISKEDLETLGKDIFKLRANIEIFQVNSLPKDGKVIDDQRDYS